MSESDVRPVVAFHPATGPRALAFGPFRFDRADRTLSRDSVDVRLPPRVLAVLECLLDRPGRVVSKQALLDAGWQDAHVAESSLTEAIGQLRQALGDSSQTPTYIQTVHRRGYRFIAPVAMEAAAAPVAPLTLVPAPAVAPVSPSPALDALAGAAGAARRPLVVPRRTAWPILIALGLAIAVLAIVPFAMRAGRTAVTRTTILLAADQAPSPALTEYPVMALAPDGTRIVYVAGTAEGYRLFERAIDQFDATPIAGTESAYGVFFSPDGASIGYFVDGWLYRMSLADRQPVRLAQAGAGFGGTWQGDHIVVATGGASGLLRVGVRDGSVAPMPIEGDRGARLRFPQALPDGRTILATEWRVTQRDSMVVAIDAITGRVRDVASGVSPRWMPPGWLAYLKNDILMVRPFPADGPSVPMLGGVMTTPRGVGQFALSAEGALVYAPSEPERRHREIIRIDEAGTRPLPFEQREFQNVAVSPDGRSIATTIYDEGASDLWIGDVARGTLVRATSAGASIDPVWTPDGRWVVFGWLNGGVLGIRRVAPDGPREPEAVGDTTDVSPTGIAADGTIIGQRLHPTRGMDIVTVTPGQAGAADWLATPNWERAPRLSPDSRWVAYESDRSGRREVYLRSFADPAAGQQMVSPAGGFDPHWARTGDAIIYRSDDAILEVGFTGGVLQPATVRSRAAGLTQLRPGDGRAFFALRRVQAERPITTFRLVSGWLNEVRGRFGR